jgi:hypothetical protein
MNRDKLTRFGYWLTTGLVAPGLVIGGLRFVVGVPDAVATFAHLGFPDYLRTLLGVSKVLAGLAILAPRSPRLKEWVYAGITFDLAGAATSHLLVGDPAGVLVGPLATLVLALTSWALRPPGRRLPDRPELKSARNRLVPGQLERVGSTD